MALLIGLAAVALAVLVAVRMAMALMLVRIRARVRVLMVRVLMAGVAAVQQRAVGLQRRSRRGALRHPLALGG